MRRRLLASYLLLTLAVLVGLVVPLALGYADRLRAELGADLQQDAFAIADFAEDTLEGNDDADLQALAVEYAERTDARVVIVDADGIAVADSAGLEPGDPFGSREEFAAALAGQVAVGERRSETLGTGLLYAAVPVASGEIYGAVRVTFSTDQLDVRVRRYWLTLGAVGVVSLAAAAGIGVLFARWVNRPLEVVTEAAERLGAGDLTARVDGDRGPPEVRALAASFNRTASRLEELIGAQEQFVGDASHQLRTPLTALRLRLEVLAEECAADGDGRVVEDVEASLAEVSRLSRIVDGLLALARADRADPEASVVPLDAGEVLAERADAWEALAGEQDVAIEVRPGTAPLLATPDRVAQVLDNLLANAVDASPAGATVWLRVEDADDGVVLHVTDDGPGMSAEDRRSAFDRLWRGDGGTGALSGSGLGLAIVRKLVLADGATVELTEADGGGVDAVVRYRRAEVPTATTTGR